MTYTDADLDALDRRIAEAIGWTEHLTYSPSFSTGSPDIVNKRWWKRPDGGLHEQNKFRPTRSADDCAEVENWVLSHATYRINAALSATVCVLWIYASEKLREQDIRIFVTDGDSKDHRFVAVVLAALALAEKIKKDEAGGGTPRQ